MLNFPGYKIFRKIYESDRSLVYRGVRSADGQPAIFKILKQDYLTPAALARHKQEYDTVEVLQLLSTQAAVSIANPKLYAEVRESQSKLTQFLEAVPVGITVHNPQGKVSYINQTGQRLLGQVFAASPTGEELVSSAQIYISGSDSLCYDQQLPALRALKGENAIADNLEVRRAGKIVPFEMHSKPIFDNKNNIVYAITAFSDIAVLKRGELCPRRPMPTEAYALFGPCRIVPHMRARKAISPNHGGD